MDEGECHLSVKDVAELLRERFAIITGGRNGEGCPIITFPDTGTFYTLLDEDYRKLMLYLTSIPPLHDSDLGFVLVIDRRNDKWSSVKTVLLKISGYFPGLIQGVFVVRPLGFFQKAISEVSNKLFKEEFKFKVVVCNCIEELHQYIDSSQLTQDLGGTVRYMHEEWIEQRMLVEQFSEELQEVSRNLRDMTIQLRSESGLSAANDVASTRELLQRHADGYRELKEDLDAAARHGDILLARLKNPPAAPPAPTLTVAAVERLIVQLDETQKGFDDFWDQHLKKLNHCLALREFEQDFKEVHRTLSKDCEELDTYPEIGESLGQIEEALIQLRAFHQRVQTNLERVEQVKGAGEKLLSEVASNGTLIMEDHECSGGDSVSPKCAELEKMAMDLRAALSHKMACLFAQRDLHSRIEKANNWCSQGVELLAAPPPCPADTEAVRMLEEFSLGAEGQFQLSVAEAVESQRALVQQVLRRVEDVSLMCHQRIATLRKVRPIAAVVPSSPDHHRLLLRKAKTVPKIEMTIKRERPHSGDNVSEPTSPQSSEEVFQMKQSHVMAELVETEQTYVAELNSIVQGYIRAMELPAKRSLVPATLVGKAHVLFGNIEEILAFHQHTFLKELQAAGSPEAVGRCFAARRDALHRLYSTYCLNKPRSEALRLQCSDDNPFFKECQQSLGHKLPLGAYLLKPVQRITKYQLLLKDLLKYSDQKVELQGALDTMLGVLRFVNDCMHQIAITGFHGNLSDYGQLLLQDNFNVWVEKKKKDRIRELRFKPCQRYIFLYEHLILFTKRCGRDENITYAFKNALKTSQIGLTENVRGSRGDKRKFEVWLHGRTQVFIIQAPTMEVKEKWLKEIKRVLIHQFEMLKGENLKQYSDKLAVNEGLRSPSPPDFHRAWEVSNNNHLHHHHQRRRYSSADQEDGWSTDGDFSQTEDEEEDEDSFLSSVFHQRGSRYVVLGDYDAVDVGEATLREGQTVEVRKVGSAGWWFVRVLESGGSQGWAPASYLGPLQSANKRHSSSPSVSSQDSAGLHDTPPPL